MLDSAGPYLLLDGTLDECIREFMAKPGPVRHLYEIHTSPQPPLVGAIYYLKRSSLSSRAVGIFSDLCERESRREMASGE